MTPRNSRRQPGINILWDRPGGVLEVDLPARADEAVGLWRQQARLLLDAVGWRDEEPAARLFPGGASLAVSAPLDGLYAATLVNEWATEAATAMLRGDAPPDLAAAAASIRREIEDSERNPRSSPLNAPPPRMGLPSCAATIASRSGSGRAAAAGRSATCRRPKRSTGPRSATCRSPTSPAST